jgi:hypothetical protein
MYAERKAGQCALRQTNRRRGDSRLGSSVQNRRASGPRKSPLMGSYRQFRSVFASVEYGILEADHRKLALRSVLPASLSVPRWGSQERVRRAGRRELVRASSGVPCYASHLSGGAGDNPISRSSCSSLLPITATIGTGTQHPINRRSTDRRPPHTWSASLGCQPQTRERSCGPTEGAFSDYCHGRRGRYSADRIRDHEAGPVLLIRKPGQRHGLHR